MSERALPRSVPDSDALRRDLGLLTEEDIAALAGVEVKTVKEWRTQRTGPPYTKFGRRPLYRTESVLRWLKDREEVTGP